MFLSKVKTARTFLLWKNYSAWLVFCACILILTNGFASLSLIRAYRFSLVDVMLTYGLLLFWGILEALIIAGLLVLLEALLERIFNKRLDLAFRLLMIAGLLVAWFLLLMAALRFIFH